MNPEQYHYDFGCDRGGWMALRVWMARLLAQFDRDGYLGYLPSRQPSFRSSLQGCFV